MESNCQNKNCSCKSNEVHQDSRRDFLGKSMAALTTAVVTGSLASAIAGCSDNESSKASSSEKVKLLTHEGHLVEVDKSHLGSTIYKPLITNQEARKGIEGKRFVMVIDLAKCDGCGACTTACQAMHFTPPDREWIKVYKMKDTEETAPYWFPKPCFQCDNPPCTKVCPVDATFKREDGIVLIDNERCIGCRFCMAACPYSTRFFNWGHPEQPEALNEVAYSPEQSYPRKVGTVEKCDFCPHMIRAGKMPSCVTACAMNAIYFGDQYEDAVTNSSGETVKLSALLEDNGAYRFMEDLGTEPRVYYLPPKNRRYPVPELNSKSEKEHEHKGNAMKM